MRNISMIILGIVGIAVVIFLLALLVGFVFNVVGWVLSYWWLWLILGGLYVIFFRPKWFCNLFK